MITLKTNKQTKHTVANKHPLVVIRILKEKKKKKIYNHPHIILEKRVCQKHIHLD